MKREDKKTKKLNRHNAAEKLDQRARQLVGDLINNLIEQENPNA